MVFSDDAARFKALQALCGRREELAAQLAAARDAAEEAAGRLAAARASADEARRRAARCAQALPVPAPARSSDAAAALSALRWRLDAGNAAAAAEAAAQPPALTARYGGIKPAQMNTINK